MTATQLEQSGAARQSIQIGQTLGRALRTYTLQESMRIERPTWLVEGLISKSITLVSGQPKSGKSALVQRLIVSILANEPFLNRTFSSPVDRVIVVATDADAVTEYRDRILDSRVALDLSTDRLILVPTEQLHADFCEKVGIHLRPQAGDVVIWDHLSDMAGDFNSQDDVSSLFAAMRRAAGDAAMIVVAHSTTSTGPNGHSSKKPLGSTVISAKARWSLHVERRGDGTRTVTSQGNAATGEAIRLSLGETATDFAVLEVNTDTERVLDRKKRDKQTLDQRQKQAEWYVKNCAELTKAEAAKKLAGQFGSSHKTWANRLTPSGWMEQTLASINTGSLPDSLAPPL